jgi:hypothetical protein
MRVRQIWIGVFVLSVILVAAQTARAANYIVYLHGRSMSGWPSAALLGPPAGWSHVTLSYNGSASLGDTAIQGAINNTVATHCGGGNQCVVVCYSAGCARMLLAYRQLQDQGRYPGGILWSEAAASAAGGSELAVIATKWWVKLLAKIFGVDGAAPIDNDVQPNIMRSGAYASIQGAATTPVYHLAGSVNICQTISILFIVKIKLCANSHFPGSYGDGVVPVHSAGGYSDTAAHATTQDGGPKYVFRAYEQTPLYPVDHRGILAPLISAGSLRLGVSRTVSCPSMPAVASNIPDASITYDDGDGAFTQESSPLNMLIVCGADNTSGVPPLYASCLSAAGCCTAFSTGNAGGCTCGESVCKQAQVAFRSYYTGTGCTGTEYAEVVRSTDYPSFDGLGMVGETAAASVRMQSARSWPDGRCQALVTQICYNDPGCCESVATTKVLASVRRVYRPAGGPTPPSGTGEDLVVSNIFYPNSPCGI